MANSLGDTVHLREYHTSSISYDSAFKSQPYLQRLGRLEHAYPALKGLLSKLANVDAGRRMVDDYYQRHNRTAGRCFLLQFEDDKVSVPAEHAAGFASSDALRQYMHDNPASESRRQNKRRLFILEDLEPDYVDALGDALGIDPLIFCEQMNTWNFSDSRSIPHRGLPSMANPGQSFTLRYYEFRTLEDPSSVRQLSIQMTFAVNRRKYEKWRDIDLPSFNGNGSDNRHGFVRRCASFWTSQGQSTAAGQPTEGWDAVILVDPAMNAASNTPGASLILRDPDHYPSRAELWNAYTWKDPGNVEAVDHKSWAYHDGCSTIAPFELIETTAQDPMTKFEEKRDLCSPLDEQVFYWTKVATANLVSEASKVSSNATFYLLKHLAQHWISQLELINCTLAKGEYLSDDFQARLDKTTTGSEWRDELVKINRINDDVNYLRRQMNYFWRVMFSNIERLGIQVGCEQVDQKLPLALRGAQQDFVTIHTRMTPLRHRVDAISAMANDLASLKAAFKGIQDSDLGARLSIFASVIFPLTLVAAILSMGEDFLPGKKDFWVFWASSLPLVVIFAFAMKYGWRLNGLVRDVKSLSKRCGQKKEAIRGVTTTTKTPGEYLLWHRRKSIDRNSGSSMA